MNDTTRHHVIDRIESLAAGAAADVAVPPFRVDRGRNSEPPPSRPSSRRRALVAAAVTASVAASGVAWAVTGNTDSQSVRTAASDPSEEIGAVVPTQWPAGIDGEINAHVDPRSLGPLEMDQLVGAAVLELDGVAAATAIALESSLSAVSFTAPNTPTPDEVAGVLDGRRALWRNLPDGALIGFVEVAANRTLIITSRTVERAGLERLASEIAASGGDPSTATLPAGWTASSPASNLPSILVLGVDHEWSTISGRSRDGRRSVSVSTMSTTDADAELERVREFAGSTGQRVDVVAEGDGMLVPFSPSFGQNGEVRHAVVWVPSPGLLSVAIGHGVGRDEVVDRDALVATARSAERATRAQWDALLPDVDAEQMQTVDGIDIPMTATAAASGASFGLRWMVIVDRPVIPDELEEDLAAVNLGLVLVDADGRRGQMGLGDPAQLTSGSGYIGTHYVIRAMLPSGTTDVAIQRNGEQLAYERVAVPGGDDDLYFTIVPAKDVGTDYRGVITATLPDGSPYVRGVR